VGDRAGGIKAKSRVDPTEIYTLQNLHRNPEKIAKQAIETEKELKRNLSGSKSFLVVVV
jgi:hypothetical protein